MPSLKKCGVCGEAGHNVTTCSYALAGCELAEMMSQPFEVALDTCRRMYCKYVPFALYHGFGVPASGGRKKLLECVLRKFGFTPADNHLYNHLLVVNRPAVTARVPILLGAARRLRRFLTNAMLNAVARRLTVVPKEMMKPLQTVITCRTERAKKSDQLVACGICFDDFKPTVIAKTGCGHDFCIKCISAWARQRGIKSFIQCPCCRTEIDELTVGNKTELKKITTGLAPKPL